MMNPIRLFTGDRRTRSRNRRTQLVLEGLESRTVLSQLAPHMPVQAAAHASAHAEKGHGNHGRGDGGGDQDRDNDQNDDRGGQGQGDNDGSNQGGGSVSSNLAV